MSEATIGIFLKAPVPGRVKTRLCPPLTAQEAADLYAGMLADTLALAAAAPAAHVLLIYDGPRPGSYLAPGILEPLGSAWSSLPQRGDDLGARLEAACSEAAGEGRLPLLLLGSDSPDLPPQHLAHALGALARGDLILGPAADGGVWCIGIRAPIPGLFPRIPWSTADAGATLGNRARDLGLKVMDVEAWQDVDELGDLQGLAQRIQHSAAAGHTRRALARWSRRRRAEGRSPLIPFEEP